MDETEVLRYAIQALRAAGISYAVTGSIASSYYGEARLTQDLDIVVWLPVRDGGVEDLCNQFPDSDFYLDRNTARQAVNDGGQFNAIHIASMFKIDFMVLHNNLYDRTRLSRAFPRDLLGLSSVMLAAPEDVIIKKMQYYREGGSEKHLRDITGMMLISGEQIDGDYIVQWAREMGLMEIWQAILKRLSER